MANKNHRYKAVLLNKVGVPEKAGINKASKSVNSGIVPVQLQRLRTTIMRWRDCINEAELAYFPFRVKMQQMFNDTILNGHTLACWSKRKRLTTQRKFRICNADGSLNEDATKLINKQWFKDFLSFALDAKGYGYSLIYLGDIVNSEFIDTAAIKRWNISPDRLTVSSFEYMPHGREFLIDTDLREWHVWVPTVNPSGATSCGMGLFYEVALYEIYLRNTLGFNMDYAQNYGQPIRVGKTTKTDEDERAVLFQSLVDMGNNASILLDLEDEIELVESKGQGQGYKVYESLEKRCEDKITKLILGHADAINSTPGKLGGTQGGEKSPAQIALDECQTEDGEFLEPLVNKELLTRMRAFGFAIPEDNYFEFLNDEEDEEIQDKKDANSKVLADVYKTISDAGGQPDWAYFTERTGIKVEKAEEPKQEKILPGKKPAFSQNLKNKMEHFYS